MTRCCDTKAIQSDNSSSFMAQLHFRTCTSGHEDDCNVDNARGSRCKLKVLTEVSTQYRKFSHWLKKPTRNHIAHKF